MRKSYLFDHPTSCRECGKAAAKHTTTEYYPMGTELEMLKRNVSNPAQSDKAKSLMRKRIEQIKTENNDTVQTKDTLPYSGNQVVLREQRHRRILWDGETYILKYGYFCSLNCTSAYANRMVKTLERG